MIKQFDKIGSVRGELTLPGDKSISHRSVMFSALAEGVSDICNLSTSHDVESTIACFSQMGVEFERTGDCQLRVKGAGYKKLRQPDKPLYAGNSGTTARLISGILIAQDFQTVLTGDESLSQRPMLRVIEPLRLFGGNLTPSENNLLPMTLGPASTLKAIDYEMHVASAQVKSAVLLAGLHVDAETTLTERVMTRDHTERMLGLTVHETEAGNKISVSRKNYPVPQNYFVPSDISSAAFFIILSLLAKDSELLIKDITLNPSRTGIIEVLTKMGADIQPMDEKYQNNEPYGDVLVRSSSLKNVGIPGELMPNIIDEIPVLSVAGLFAEGNFKIRGARELRVKESDRIKSICENYKLLGLDVEEYEDGFEIGGQIRNYDVKFESYGDHRIAMAFAVLSMLMEKGGSVNGFDCINISNPGFLSQIQKIVG